MRIRLVSDIHLEFGPFTLPKMRGEKNQILCIAGDLNPARCLYEVDLGTGKSTEVFFDSLKDRFKAVVYISGNHEYYHGDVAEDDKNFRDLCNIYGFYFLQGESIKIDDVTFIGATLWTDFDKQNGWVMNRAAHGMNDYRVISDSSRKVEDKYLNPWNDKPTFTPNQALLYHYSHLNIIQDEIELARADNPEAKVVVMTHHAPHHKSIHQHYRSSGLNGAYYTDLDWFLKTYRPNYWFHGHVHNNFKYKVHDTTVVCNPRGYHGYEENPNFNPKMTVGFKKDVK